MDGFDPGGFLPDLSAVVENATLICRIAVLIGPVILQISVAFSTTAERSGKKAPGSNPSMISLMESIFMLFPPGIC